MEDMPESDQLPKNMIKIREVYIYCRRRGRGRGGKGRGGEEEEEGLHIHCIVSLPL